MSDVDAESLLPTNKNSGDDRAPTRIRKAYKLRPALLVSWAFQPLVRRTLAVSYSPSSLSTSTYHSISDHDSDADHDHDSEKEEQEDQLPVTVGADNLQDSPGHISIDFLSACEGTELIQCIYAAKIVKDKNLDTLRNFGGVKKIAEELKTDLEEGIPGNSNDIERRQKIQLPESHRCLSFARLLVFLFDGCKNYTIFLLMLAEILALAFGIEEEGIDNGCFDGALIFLTIVLLIIFHAINKYLQERAREKSRKNNLAKERELGSIDVTRGGQCQQIPIHNLLCGDIVHLKRGTIIPADGLFASDEALKLDDGVGSIINEENPFLFYGARVVDGNAKMLVTSVGPETAWSELMSRTENSTQKTTLDARLDKVATCTHIVGLLITILIIVVLFLRYVSGKFDEDNGSRDASKEKPTAVKMFLHLMSSVILKPKGTARGLTVLLSLSLAGIMEGVPFVISLSIIYWDYKILSNKGSALDLVPFVTLGSVTTICTDKIGGLSENPIIVHKLLIGEEEISDNSVISPIVFEALSDGITLSAITGSTYDKTLFSWAEEKLGLEKETLNQRSVIHKANGLDHNEQFCLVLMEKDGPDGQGMNLHYIGYTTGLLNRCSFYYDRRGERINVDDNKKKVFNQAIKNMEENNLQLIGFACKSAKELTLEANGLTLIALMGLKNTSRDETEAAVTKSTAAGLRTVLVSGDDVESLRKVAETFDLIPSDSNALVIRGEDFCNFTEEERMEKADQIRIMGNSEPLHKLLLVQYLRKKGKTVAVVGQRVNDAPAMQEADVGIAMGSWSSGKARESCNVIVWDGTYSFLIQMIKNVRCLHENSRKFIQVQLIMTISELSMNLTGTLIVGDAPITAIQLFWVNMVVSLLGGLAILTEIPTGKEIDDNKLVLQKEPLINMNMWRNIIIQASYQISLSVILQEKGKAILGISAETSKSMIFHSFFLCQFFNQFNAREMEKKNFLKGLFCKSWFWVCLGLLVMLHLGYVMIEPIVLNTARLNWKEWAGCFTLGLLTWGFDWIGKYVSEYFVKCQKQFSRKLYVSSESASLPNQVRRGEEKEKDRQVEEEKDTNTLLHVGEDS